MSPFRYLLGVVTTFAVVAEAKKISEKIKEKIIQDIFLPDPALAATVLRFTFHDCIGNLGGCDGCLNLNQVANNGLAGIKLKLDRINRRQFRPGRKRVSRADLYVLAGIAAVEFGLQRNRNAPWKKTTIRFRSGRRDGFKCRGEDEIFPMDVDGLETLGGLSKEESAAIIGAHTMGKVNGFRFIAQPPTDHLSFDNKYYKLLTDRSIHWHQFQGIKPVGLSFGLQDVNGDGVLDARGHEHRASYISDTDLHLAKKLPRIVRNFANNEVEWMNFFDRAMQKIIQRGLRRDRHV